MPAERYSESHGGVGNVVNSSDERRLQHLVRSDPDVRDALMWLRVTTDGELAWLYAHASLRVYPSIVEGWGLSIAEALTNGKFCITCDTTSMPEIAGAIKRYATAPKLLAERTERIKNEYRFRSWDDTSAAVKASLVGE